METLSLVGGTHKVALEDESERVWRRTLGEESSVEEAGRLTREWGPSCGRRDGEGGRWSQNSGKKPVIPHRCYSLTSRPRLCYVQGLWER